MHRKVKHEIFLACVENVILNSYYVSIEYKTKTHPGIFVAIITVLTYSVVVS